MMPRRARGSAVAIALYLVLVFLSFLPQSLRPRDTIAYVGDSLESVYIVAWNVHQLFRSPTHLFDANVLYPHPRALAFTDHRLLPSLAVAPVLWATGNAVLATNLAVGLACLLAAVGGPKAGHGPRAASGRAWAAGALYAFHTYQINEAPRLNIVAHGFIAFALAELILYLRTGERRQRRRTAASCCCRAELELPPPVRALVIALVVLGALAARPREVGRRLPMLAAATLAAALLFAPVALPYVRSAREQGYVRDLGPGIGLAHYFSTSPTNLFYGAIGTDVHLQQRGPHFVGFLSLALALFALAEWGLRRPRDPGQGALPPSVWVPAAAAGADLMSTRSGPARSNTGSTGTAGCCTPPRRVGAGGSRSNVEGRSCVPSTATVADANEEPWNAPSMACTLQ
jgi:hypothetical protein